MMTRPEQITLGMLLASGAHGLLICCGAIIARIRPASTRTGGLTDAAVRLEDKFTCMVCGARRADVRPDFD